MVPGFCYFLACLLCQYQCLSCAQLISACFWHTATVSDNKLSQQQTTQQEKLKDCIQLPFLKKCATQQTIQQDQLKGCRMPQQRTQCTRSTHQESTNTEGVSTRKVVLRTEDNQAVEFKTKEIRVNETMEKGNDIETEMDYFSYPNKPEDKHLVTLIQKSYNKTLLLTKESSVLKAVDVQNFEEKKAAIKSELAGSSAASTAQCHLFYLHFEASGDAQFQSFDGNYYLTKIDRNLCLLQQNQGARQRFKVNPSCRVASQ